ncbi:MAG: adenylyltransferase/cytidyltransferase family protein, partial [Planctomycetota bacterium]
MSSASKIHPPDELADLLASHRRAGRRIVFTNGGFDLLHVGHVRALEEAATLGGVLVVAVNDDDSVRAAKGPGRPIVPAAERAELVAGLGCVDYVTIFGDRTADGLLEHLRPNVHAKGRDYTPDTVPERKTNEALGIEIAIVGDAKVHSSTEILARAAGTREPLDRVRPLGIRGLRGFALAAARRRMEGEGWMDLARLASSREGTIVHQRRGRFVRRIEVDGIPLYVKVIRPLERRRSPIREGRNHLALRAAGFRAPEPWLAAEGRVDDREEVGVLVTREDAGLPLDEYLALAAGQLGPRAQCAVARGIGSTLR